MAIMVSGRYRIQTDNEIIRTTYKKVFFRYDTIESEIILYNNQRTIFSLLLLAGCGDEAPKKTEIPAKACGDIAGSKSCWYIADAEIAVPGLLQNWLSQAISGGLNVAKNL